MLLESFETFKFMVSLKIYMQKSKAIALLLCKLVKEVIYMHKVYGFLYVSIATFNTDIIIF